MNEMLYVAGTKYQSSLNEIDKSEQKSPESPAKGTQYEWPEDKHNGTKFTGTLQYFLYPVANRPIRPPPLPYETIKHPKSKK